MIKYSKFDVDLSNRMTKVETRLDGFDERLDHIEQAILKIGNGNGNRLTMRMMGSGLGLVGLLLILNFMGWMPEDVVGLVKAIIPQ